MKIKDVAKLSPEDRFIYWIKERSQIRMKRKAGKNKPWTNDVILQSYRFCNVRRMDDKVSQWLLKNWYEPNYNHKNALIACCLARHFNNTDALELIGFPLEWEPEVFKKKLQQRKSEGLNVFNSAYVITGKHGADKIESVIDYTLQPIYDSPTDLRYSSIQNWCEVMQQFYCIGSFMAGQIISDFRWAVDGAWYDKLTWAPMGPGSKRGMNRFYSRDIETPINQNEFTYKLLEVIKLCKKRLPSICERLEAIDYQNCFCEFDKYNRALLGDGKPKQKYPGV